MCDGQTTAVAETGGELRSRDTISSTVDVVQELIKGLATTNTLRICY